MDRSVGRIFINFSNWIPYNLSVYSKTCLNKRQISCLFYQYHLTHFAGPGGVGYSYFCKRWLGPSIYCSPQKNIRNFKHPKEIFEILATHKISQFCTLTLKKTLNSIEMTLKLAQFCDDPQKISTKS